jgi:hypothetical protein
MIKQPLTEQQLFDLFRPAVQMPPDVRKRIRHRVMAEARKLRKLHQLHRRSQLRRRVAGVVVAIVLVMLAVGSAEAQVRCDPCRMRVMLPIIRNGEAVR